MSEAGPRAAGPLAGYRVVEFAGIGPGPHCAMLLADMGADVLRIDRDGGNGWPNPVVDRGRATMTLDLRDPAGQARAIEAADTADVLIEGFRPGVMERLGLGPDTLCASNPRLVYGRMTGWGQEGPLARTVGHDINYIALTGALAAMGRPGEPSPPPLNLVGDFGGGSLFLAFGIVAALLERERSGRGQVVDAAIVDGVSSLMTMFAGGRPALARERSLLGGAAPFYRCYVCADGRQVSVGALEPAFYRALIDGIGAPPAFREGQMDVATWPERSRVLAGIFAARSSADWMERLAGVDACVAPVVAFEDAPAHPHLAARGTYVDGTAVAPAPRLSRTPGRARPTTADGDRLLRSWKKAEAAG